MKPQYDYAVAKRRPLALSIAAAMVAAFAMNSQLNAQTGPYIENGNMDEGSVFDHPAKGTKDRNVNNWTAIPYSKGYTNYATTYPSSNGGRYAQSHTSSGGKGGGLYTKANGLTIGEEYILTFEQSVVTQSGSYKALWWELYTGANSRQKSPELLGMSDTMTRMYSPTTGQQIFGSWEQSSISFTATEEEMYLTFTPRDDRTQTHSTGKYFRLGLDGVSIMAANPVPEPGVPMLIGLAGLTFIIYRRR